MKRMFIILLTFFAATQLQAQQNIGFTIAFNHLALSVTDLNRSAGFYKSVMQLPEITNLSGNDGMRWFSLAGGRELHLISVNKEAVFTNKSIHLAFSNVSFAAVLKRLQDLKIAYSNWQGTPNTVNTRADGIKQVYFQDPDGYWIEINNVGEEPASVKHIQNELWQLEENYWKYVKAKDYTAYLSLWDDNFIGYPSTNKIGGKDHITDWIKEMYAGNKNNFDYALTRHVENVFDDIVIVLYDATQLWKNDKGELVQKSTYKLTHTWKKTAAGWKIIGGMGAAK
jgi:lactoylglutathione lyase